MGEHYTPLILNTLNMKPQIFNHETGDEDDLYLINAKLSRDKFERLSIKTFPCVTLFSIYQDLKH